MTTPSSESLEFKDLLKNNQTITKELTRKYDGNSNNISISIIIFIFRKNKKTKSTFGKLLFTKKYK